MYTLGLIGILLTIGMISLWFANFGPITQPSSEDSTGTTSKESLYVDTLDSAHELVDQLNNKTAALSNKPIYIYDGISVPENTEVLDLSGKNLFGSLKAEIRLLKNLKELNLSNNKFTGLPAEVGQLSKLEVLNLSNNYFTGLPHELGKLSNLKVLDLRGVQYSIYDLEVIKEHLSPQIQILKD